MFPGLDLNYADAAQHIITACTDPAQHLIKARTDLAQHLITAW